MANISKVRAGYIKQIENHGLKCALCREPLIAKATGLNRLKKGGKGTVTVDHIIPRALGGTNDIRNLQPAHLRCNMDKADKLIPPLTLKTSQTPLTLTDYTPGIQT